MKTSPLVSVCVQTYQHGSFIRKCLDSIISQKMDFPIEIIIGEDESTDGTREICQEYAARYPELIRLFLRSRKDVIYINGKATGRYNFIRNLQAACGKYVALCEGDDFWVDQNKLQKQVTFLEEREDYSIVFNSYDKLINNEIISGIVFGGEIDFERFMKKNSKTLPIQTNSSLFRRNPGNIEFFSRHFRQTITGDYALFLLTLTTGKGYCFEDVMSVYRLHEGGVSNNFRPLSWYEIRINVLEKLLKQNKVPPEYVSVAKTYLKQIYRNYSIILVKRGQLVQGATKFQKWIFSRKPVWSITRKR